MSPAEPPTLEYGRVATQFGVTIEHPPDGGVVVTVPAGNGRRPRRFDILMMTLLARLFPKSFGNLPPPRAVLRLTSEGLSINEPVEEGAIGETTTQSWPLHEVEELRPNRYWKGLYVHISGKENFDALADVDGRLVALIGREMEEALARLQRTNAPAPEPGAGGAADAATNP